jgi:hypothetical protein
MTLANIRENGVRSLLIRCRNCHHEKITNVDHLPGDPTVPTFGPRMVCTRRGIIGADARPHWHEQSTPETTTAQLAIPMRRAASGR